MGGRSGQPWGSRVRPAAGAQGPGRSLPRVQLRGEAGGAQQQQWEGREDLCRELVMF